MWLSYGFMGSFSGDSPWIPHGVPKPKRKSWVGGLSRQKPCVKSTRSGVPYWENVGTSKLVATWLLKNLMMANVGTG